jgi:hypothetical protein
VRRRAAVLVALVLAGCGVKAAPRPAASSGADAVPATAAPAGSAPSTGAAPAPAPCDPASGGACGR